AAALLEHLLERRRDDGRLRIIFELGANAVHQVHRTGEHPASRRKACDGIGGDRRQQRHQRARKDIAYRRRWPEAGRPKATSRTVSQAGLGAVRSKALRATVTRDRESIRKWRCAVSIRTLSVWVPK